MNRSQSNTISNAPVLYSIQEAADITGLHPNTIRNHISSQRLKALRIGKLIRIDSVDLLSLLTPYRGGDQGVWNKSAGGF